MVTPLQKKWFRIELAKDGSISSCTEVDAAAKTRGGSVRYYEALSAAEACRDAKDWYTNHRAKQTARARKRRERLRAERRCVHCGSAELATRHACQVCKDRQNALKRAREAGAEPLRPRHPTPEAAREAVREQRRAEDLRRYADEGRTLQDYRRLLAKFDTLGADAFRAWLVERIAALSAEVPQAAE